MNFEKFLADFKLAQEEQKAFVVVTFVSSKGSAPQEVGARMIVTSQGHFSGTVGGGKLEMAAIKQAQEYLSSQSRGSHFHDWNLQTDIKMSCGGAVGLFFEVHNPSTAWNIVIFGAGHVAQELIRVLLRLECRVQCFDTRIDWLEKLPQDSKLRIHLSNDLPTVVNDLDSSSFIVCATMGHATDLPILEKILKAKTFSYVGVLGSDLKAKKMRKSLSEAHITQEKLESFYCPMGEDIGNNTPAEIAISVSAQLLKIRDKIFKPS